MASQKMSNGQFSILPVCIFKDDFENGERIHKMKLNDVFRPIPRAVARSVCNAMQAEYTFTPYHYHEGIEILRINRGCATVVINSAPIKAFEGDVIIVNSFELHGLYLASADVSFSRTCVMFHPYFLFPMEGGDNHFFENLRDIRFENHIPASHPAAVELCRTIDNMVGLYRDQPNGWSVSVYAALIRFYALIAQHALYKEESEASSYMFGFMQRVSDYIDKNLEEPISTADIAAYCQYSTEHFCRLFKKCFNQTFKEYLNAFRVQKAKAFIDLGSSATLAAVSSKFGFTNQNHFSRMFKKHIGVLPSEYMNQKKEIK